MGLSRAISRTNEVQETIANGGKKHWSIFLDVSIRKINLKILLQRIILELFVFWQGFDYREVFRKIDDDFRMIMKDALKDTRVVSILRIGSVKSILNTMLDRLERCQKSLNEFLEEKRSSFPRYFFISPWIICMVIIIG